MAGMLAVVALTLLPASPAAAACAPPYCQSYKLTVVKEGTGSGTVTSSPAGINCGPTCSHPFEASTKVSLTATAAPGSTFIGWSGGGCSGIGTCTLTIKADTAVTATFKATPPPPPPCNKVTLGSAKRRGTSVMLKVTIPCPGKLVATGRRMRTLRMKVGGSGTVTMTLKLTAAGLRALKESKTHRLKVKVTVTFTPRDNGTVIARRKTVIFRDPRE
jgi:hypothetical protein